MVQKNGVRQIAIYGKGSIGKSTIACNVSVAMAEKGYKVMQVGCSPKIDSTALLLGGKILDTDILTYTREHGVSEEAVTKTIQEGIKGILCAEAGGPEPASGCAGRGVALALEYLAKYGVYDKYGVNFIIYDAIADVVCGGFGQPMKKGYASEVYLVTSGEMMSAYSANNICMAVKTLAEEGAPTRMGGLIANMRGVDNEEPLLRDFALKLGVPIMEFIPRSQLVQRAEAKGGPVLTIFPESKEAQQYKRLAEKIHDNKARVIPTPMTLQDIFDLAKKYMAYER